MGKNTPRKRSLRIRDILRNPSFLLIEIFGTNDGPKWDGPKEVRKLRRKFFGPNSALNWVEGFFHILYDYVFLLPLMVSSIFLGLFFKFKKFTFPIVVIGFLVLLLYYPFIQMLTVFTLIVVVIITLVCILSPIVQATIYEPFKQEKQLNRFWMSILVILWATVGSWIALPILSPYLPSLLCPPGYENISVQFSTRTYDLPRVVQSIAIFPTCAGEAGRYTPLFYHVGLVMTGAYLAWWGFLFLGGRLVTGYIWRNRKTYQHIRCWSIAAFAVAGMAVLLAIPQNVPAVGRSVFAVLQVGRGGGGGIDGRLFNPILEGDLPKVRALLDQGASPNSRDAVTFSTALYRAVSRAEPDVVELLLKRGADPNLRSGPREKRQPGKGILPLSMALEKTPSKLMERDRLKIARLLVENGADLNAFDINPSGGGFGYTALFQAVVRKNVKVVRYLLEKGADPNAGIKDNDTALHQSVWNFKVSIEITRLLLKAGADPNLVTRDGTPLFYLLGTSFGNIRGMKALLKAGADPNGRDKKGRTALMVVRRSNSISSLLKAGADPSAVDGQGKSVLEFQSGSNENKQLIQKALEANAGR